MVYIFRQEGYRKAGDLIASKPLKVPSLAIKKLTLTKADEIPKYYYQKRTHFSFTVGGPQNDAYATDFVNKNKRIAQEEPAQIEPFIAKQEAVIYILT